VLAHDALQSSAQPSTGDFRFRFGRQVRALHPRVPAGGPAVAANPEGHDGGPPSERRMGKPADPGIAGGALGSASGAELIVEDELAFDDRAGCSEVLPGSGQSELLKGSEGRQVRGAVGSIEHGRELSTVWV